MTQLLLRILRTRWSVAAALVLAGAAAMLACGPFFTDYLTIRTSAPVSVERYGRGELGVVKPTFARRYLVQAYRALGGAPAAAPAQAPGPARYPMSAAVEWQDLQEQILKGLPPGPPARPVDPERRSQDFSSFTNCLEPAFQSARATLNARVAQYGARSREVADWLAAQMAVFQNCDGTALVLPSPAPVWADTRLKADRDYQTAAAYFYATQYDEAAGRFRALSSNAESPWRAYGRYLAGRALIRSATVPAEPKDRLDRLAAAERELQATLADPQAKALHASARDLLGFIASRSRPVQRLQELARRLTAPGPMARQDLIDYTWLMDVFHGELSAPAAPQTLFEAARGDDLTAWIVAMQEGGTRAVDRWQEARSDRWLVAALWTTPPRHEAVPGLLEAAAAVPRTSPAFATAAFLRVRLLIQRGEFDRARAALAPLPVAEGPGIDAETLNLLRAARFAVAGTLEELLDAAPRAIVAESSEGTVTPVGTGAPNGASTFDQPAWDDDVAALFNTRLPLERLVAAAESDRLSPRLRRRVAQAAFARAVVLKRPAAGLRAARVLRELAAPMRGDLDAYISARDEEARHRAAVLSLLRTPGLSVNAHGQDNNDSYARVEPARQFGHAFPRNWWCDIAGTSEAGAASLMFGGQRMPFPGFITDAERLAVGSELEAITTVGEPRAYLMAAAIDWAQARRTDPLAAEALALAIEGWRWSPCGGGTKSPLPARAFAILHRQFPDTDAARRTKYWYD